MSPACSQNSGGHSVMPFRGVFLFCPNEASCPFVIARSSATKQSCGGIEITAPQQVGLAKTVGRREVELTLFQKRRGAASHCPPFSNLSPLSRCRTRFQQSLIRENQLTSRLCFLFSDNGARTLCRCKSPYPCYLQAVKLAPVTGQLQGANI